VEAVRVYIRLGRSDVFNLVPISLCMHVGLCTLCGYVFCIQVREAKLFEHIRDQVAILMQFDPEKVPENFAN